MGFYLAQPQPYRCSNLGNLQNARVMMGDLPTALSVILPFRQINFCKNMSRTIKTRIVMLERVVLYNSFLFFYLLLCLFFLLSKFYVFFHMCVWLKGFTTKFIQSKVLIIQKWLLIIRNNNVKVNFFLK